MLHKINTVNARLVVHAQSMSSKSEIYSESIIVKQAQVKSLECTAS